jgi:hypothetical protein
MKRVLGRSIYKKNMNGLNTFLKIKQEASGWPKWCKTQEDWELSLKDYYKIEEM